MIWLVLLTLASAADRSFPEIAKSDGTMGAMKAVEEAVAAAKNDKKLQEALAARELKKVAIPVVLMFGADIVLASPTPMKACTWDGSLTCRAAAKASSTPGSYVLTCANRFGASLELSSIQSRKDDYVIWTVANVEKCWALGGSKITVRPSSSDALDGVGQGTEFIPPELTGLTWQEVEALILEHNNMFRHCHEKAEGDRGVGKLVLEFELAKDGGRAAVTVAKESTYTAPAVEQCILERFHRINFPATRDGFSEGSFPIVFQ
jgi:hypothetical protein